MAVGGLFSPVLRVLRCVSASRLAQSATERQPMTGKLLPVQREVSRFNVAGQSPGVLFCRPEAFGLLICEFRRQLAFAVYVRPEVVISRPEVVL